MSLIEVADDAHRATGSGTGILPILKRNQQCRGWIANATQPCSTICRLLRPAVEVAAPPVRTDLAVHNLAVVRRQE
ncbi:MAG: hypothetical protein ACJ8EL_03790, partial [Rhizomicrobium sp.]